MAVFFTPGTAAAQSSDFTLAAGDVVTIFLVDDDDTDGLPANALIDVQIKSGDGEYFTVGSLTTQHPAYCMSSPGTYRLNRHASASVGADKV